MKKKLVKAFVTVVGVIAFSELFGIIGEVQALISMREVYPKEVDEILDVLENAEEFKEEAPLINRKKCELVSKVAKFAIENEVFKNYSKN